VIFPPTLSRNRRGAVRSTIHTRYKTVICGRYASHNGCRLAHDYGIHGPIREESA
jgi:hypothetical protein